MRNPSFGEANLGAVAGAVVAGMGGLFAIGIVRVIVYKDISLFLGTPKLNLLSWLVCLPFGWFLGGQIGPRMGEGFQSARAEIVGGIIGGIIPLLLMASVGWYVMVRY
ncbi:MAG: hypothetical protein C5B50_21085 [Verrucomicrobia bacterium]|nr:MAG: hypothetical protein C5B50_21085 [Verrucomicrobiota bacterium]